MRRLAALALLLSAGPAAGGTLVVLNKAEATATLVDTSTGLAAATLPVGVGPHEVAVSPDGRLAIACNYGESEAGNTLSVIDVPRARVVRTFDLGEHRRPHGILFEPDGRHVLVTSEQSRALLRVDVEAGRVVRTFDTAQPGSHMVATDPGFRRAYTANIMGGSITAFDLQTGERLGIVPTGEGAEGIAVTPDGLQVWVANNKAGTVSVVDALELKVIDTLQAGGFPIRAAASPDGRRVFVTAAQSSELIVFDAKSRREAGRLKFDANALGLDASMEDGGPFSGSSVPIGILLLPDGRRACVAHARGSVLTLVDLETLEVVDRWKAGERPDGMAWSKLDVKPSEG